LTGLSAAIDAVTVTRMMSDGSSAGDEAATLKAQLIRRTEELHDELTRARTDWSRVLATARELSAALPDIEALARPGPPQA
jgi:hypothetical protein